MQSVVIRRRTCINKLPSIYIYIALCEVSVSKVFFVPGEQTFFTHRRGQTFFTHRGDKLFFAGGGGGFDDVDEETDVSKANFLVSAANIFVSEACKLSAGARILGARRALKFK